MSGNLEELMKEVREQVSQNLDLTRNVKDYEIREMIAQVVMQISRQRYLSLNEKKEDAIKIFDLLIKEQFYVDADLEKILDIISTIEINTFDNLVILEGFLHGTGTEEILENISSDLSQIISTRDDIMVYLMQRGIDRITAYNIMENVRKGKGLTKEMETTMSKYNVPNWYIKLCNKIEFLFPKAHNVEHAILEYRLAWYGIHYPKEYSKVMEKWRK